MYNDEFIKAEEKRLYDEYKKQVANLKKVQKEKDAVGQVFTKGLLPIYGGIYPLLKKLEKQGFVTGSWDDPKRKIQKVYSLTPEGFKEFEEKKHLLKPKIKEALEVFKIIYSHLYN